MRQVHRFIEWFVREVPEEYREYVRNGMHTEFNRDNKFSSVTANLQWESWEQCMKDIPGPSVVNTAHENQAYITLGFVNERQRDAFMRKMGIGS
ncbi:hypothetical protein JXVLWARM_CDS_0094 [Burkholderia phage Bm1]